MMVMSKFLEKEKFWSAKEDENCGERDREGNIWSAETDYLEKENE